MKFEDLLMEQGEDNQKRLLLQEEVLDLQVELEGQQALNNVLQCALDGPSPSHSFLSSWIPPTVRVLLVELAMVEEEIIYLERKIEDMKLSLIQERRQSQEWQMLQPEWRMLLHDRRRRQPNHSLSAVDYQAGSKGDKGPSKSLRKSKNVGRQRRNSPCSASDSHSIDSTRSDGSPSFRVYEENRIEEPNELSEELIRCLISIFLEYNRVVLDQEGSSFVSSLTLACVSSKSRSFSAKASSSFKMTPKLDPYGVLDLDATLRDIGNYRRFMQITRDTLGVVRLKECSPNLGKLRVLMHKLCTVDLASLTDKQKLAFWINIYNSCIMHAFLEYGLPSSQEKLLQLMNKAVLNIGGIVLNALAIEHFILRHPGEEKTGSQMDEKEVLLRQAYGLGYPEPNVTFALCRGSWSSPALRVYTPEEVVNELKRAKVEYLEASVGLITTNGGKIIIPKLLQWHMRDFADDMGSLVEWIYRQLPRSGTLKRLMMEVEYPNLREGKSPASRVVEIQPYESEFRYLLAMYKEQV